MFCSFESCLLVLLLLLLLFGFLVFGFFWMSFVDSIKESSIAGRLDGRVLLVVQCSRGMLNLLKFLDTWRLWSLPLSDCSSKAQFLLVELSWLSYSLVFVESDELFDDFGMSFG